MKRGWQRLLLLGAIVLVVLALLALSYRHLMFALEGQERSFLRSLGWASETLTSTGYGSDVTWESPVMVAFVICAQFLGQGFLLVAFPFVVIPFFEERFELRLPRSLPQLKDYVLIYRNRYALDSLIKSLSAHDVPVVIFEEDEANAKALRDRGYRVVFGNIHAGPEALRGLENARAIVANASDDNNTSMVMWARELGYTGPIYALVASPSHTRPLVLAGATEASAPNRILADALAAKASILLSPPIVGLDLLSGSVCAAQFRIGPDSPLLGLALAQAKVRARTGATILSVSDPGELVFTHNPGHKLILGGVVHAVGAPKALESLAALAGTGQMHLQGPILVIGHGRLGSAVAKSLREAQEHVVVIDKEALPGVDLVGDALEPSLLVSAGVQQARAVVVALSADSSTILATALIRELSIGAPVIARVHRRGETDRIYRIGADFALSSGDVVDDMLLPLILDNASERGDSLPRVRPFEVGMVQGKTLQEAELFDNPECNVVALARGPELMTDLDAQTEVMAGDILYVCGTERALSSFAQRFETQTAEADLTNSAAMSNVDLPEVRSPLAG